MVIQRINRYRPLLTGLILLVAMTSYAQSKRLTDRNAIGWYVYTGDHKISDKWKLHTEYQWRRVDFIRSWQQSLARLGATYAVSKRVKVGGAYTYFVTFPYGKYPQADQEAPYSEHRIHEDIELSETYGRLKLSHRFRLEQRWLSQLAANNPRQIVDWQFQNRIRYQLTAEVPLQGVTLDDGEFYLNFFDELFIGFGQNVEENVFNQNRISGGLGYQFRKGMQLELNYLNQIVQHAERDPITNQSVFENNNGFRLNLAYNLDFTRHRQP